MVIAAGCLWVWGLREPCQRRAVLCRKGWFPGTKYLVWEWVWEYLVVWECDRPALPTPDPVGSAWQAPRITDKAAWRLADLPSLPELDLSNQPFAFPLLVVW